MSGYTAWPSSWPRLCLIQTLLAHLSVLRLMNNVATEHTEPSLRPARAVSVKFLNAVALPDLRDEHFSHSGLVELEAICPDRERLHSLAEFPSKTSAGFL